ncbi:MAG: PorP/SprF family type IX secretion system membrane protein [Flavobacteriales bacterium]|jgi:type IX secretion system PorP/SprF family membrane protein|nr:PorP/SprF family type IX secretion system membrane protein [Flavobacteriales bacterium]
MRKMKTNKILPTIALAIMGCCGLRAQDGQLSQYEMGAVMLNPALTGMFENAEFRMGANVRNQWGRLGSNFTTTNFSYENNVQQRYGFGSYLSNNNMAGIINTFQFGVSGAYNVSEKSAKHTLSVGATLGLIYKKLNMQELVWDAQYDDGYFNTDLPTGEFFEKGARLMPEVALGVAYRSIDRGRRVNPFGNFAMYHITSPDESILRVVKAPLPIRYGVNGGARVKVTEQVTLVPQALYWRQGKDQLINAGILAEVPILGSVYSAVGGAAYRFGDAAIIHLGVKHKSSVYRFSYDINTSPLKQYTNNHGAFEFSILYYGTHSGRDAGRRLQSSTF